MTQRTALITGASGGIGLELTKLFAAQGFDLVLVARSEDTLHQIADELEAAHGISARVLPADLADPDAPQHIYDALEGTPIDVLINNAGFGLTGRFTDIDLGRQMNMIQVNVNALTALAGLFMPSMAERGYGRVMNVASTAAFQPGPKMAVYYATKAFVLSLSEALSKEMEGTGVTVTALCPGPTITGFQEVSDVDETRLFKVQQVMTAEEVAQRGFDALMDGKPVIIPGIQNQLNALTVRVTPRPMVREIVNWMQSEAE